MKGALLVFEAMLEENADGSLTLPVSISPEYRDARIDAWGRNSSFQLAAIHRLAENLLTAAEILGIQPYPGAVKIKEKLPQFSLQDGEIALWENLLLEESHRHHSHLAGITPFCTIDPFDPAMRDIVEKSIYRLTVLGMGQWVGWCMPWASQIYTRCGNGNMAELILKIWEDGFTNDGGGSLHDGRYKGFTMYAQFRGEVMQMDGGMGAVAAIQDQFLHVYNGELRAFYGVPPQLRGISFSGMFAPDGMKVSGEISENGTVSLEIYAAKAASLAISVPGSEIFRADAAAGETISLVKQGNTLCRR